MYERSAIVLENYFSKIFRLDRTKNLKVNYEEYAQMIEEIKEYQRVMQEEERVIKKFDESAEEIEEIQRKQHQLHEDNMNLENQRDQIFNDLSENPSTLDQQLEDIEQKLEENNSELKYIRERYVKALVIFTERQKERNKYARIHRTTESDYLNHVKQIVNDFGELEPKEIQQIKKFAEADKTKYIEEIVNIMLKNGRNERIPFNNSVIKNAVEVRMKIAEQEAELYVSVYERMKKLIIELNSGNIKLAKSEKLLRDVSVKFNFLNAEKEYIVSFLDNERITSMNGRAIHEELMKEACQNFIADIKQINNLYELVVKETIGKATKKAYKELYNKTYLKNIQEKERDFEEEVTNIKINMGTVINSNYWRIEGIKNIYNTFQDEIGEKFSKDLSDYKVEDLDEPLVSNINEGKSKKPEKKSNIIEEYDEIDSDDENYQDDYDDGYDDYEENDNYDEDEYDDYDEDYDEDYDDDDYDEDYDEYDDYDEDNYDDDYDYDDEYYENNDEEEIIFDREEDDELTEEKLDEYIAKNRKNKNSKKEEKGLFGKLFGK